jgi:hypothetical protein
MVEARAMTNWGCIRICQIELYEGTTPWPQKGTKY